MSRTNPRMVHPLKKGKHSAFSVHTARSNNILQLKKNNEINLQNMLFVGKGSFKLPAIEDGDRSD